MKQTFFLAILIGSALVAGCDGHKGVGPLPPSPIPFELILPSTIPQGSYYAVSGLSIQNETVKLNDSTVDAPVSRFYAQFNPAPGISVPETVLLNNNKLVANLGSDTLRLENASGATLYENNTWSLADSGVAAVTFTSPTITPIDSATPFSIRPVVRGDTALTIGWKRAESGNAGLQLVWQVTNQPDIYRLNLNDFSGGITIPKEVMKTLVGTGKVTLIRYRFQTENYGGKNLIVVRTAQRTYKVTVTN